MHNELSTVIVKKTLEGKLTPKDGTVFSQCHFEKVVFPEILKGVGIHDCKLNMCDLGQTIFDGGYIIGCTLQDCSTLKIKENCRIHFNDLNDCMGIEVIAKRPSWWMRMILFLKIKKRPLFPEIINNVMY